MELTPCRVTTPAERRFAPLRSEGGVVTETAATPVRGLNVMKHWKNYTRYPLETACAART